MSLQPGDRVRWATTGDDGLPLVRYGFVGGCNGSRAVVMFDGELKGDQWVALAELEPVTITNIELRLRGSDLLADPSLRDGLVSLWAAEAEQAGLEVCSVEWLGAERLADRPDELVLAEVLSGGQSYMLQAAPDVTGPDVVRVRAVPPTP